jgi:hypothetical protein
MTNIEEAIAAAKEYETIKQFRNDNPLLYSRIAKAKAYDVAFAHVRRIRVTQDMYAKGRHCTKCLKHKPIEQFIPVRSASARRRAICKTCHSSQAADWREANLEKSRENVRASAARYPEKVRERAKIKRSKNPAASAARDMLKRCLLLTGQRKSRTTEKTLGYSAAQLRDHIASQFVDGMTWDNWGKWHIDHKTPVAVMVRNGVTDPAVINALDNLGPLWAKDNLAKVWEARGDRAD